MKKLFHVPTNVSPDDFPKNFGVLSVLLLSFLLNAGPVNLFETPNDEESWETQAGYNLRTAIKTAVRGPDDKTCTGFQIEFKDPSLKKGDSRWFNITKSISSEASWEKAEGIAFELASNRRNGWYVSWELIEEDGTKFSPAMTPLHSLPERFTRFKYQFRDLVCKEDKNRKIRPEKIIGISFGGGAAPGTIYFRGFELLKQEPVKTKPFLLVRITGTRHPSHTLEPGQDASLRVIFKKKPEQVQAVQLEITDYYEKVVRKEKIESSKRLHRINLGKLPTGYYEVRGYAVDKNGTVDRNSIILTSGTQIPGIYTFMVAAETEEAVIQDIRRRTTDSFYGIQNIRDQFGAATGTGAPWKIEMPRWNWDEPARPKLDSNGVSPQTREKLKQPPQPDYLFAICSFTNHAAEVPGWAKTKRTEQNKRGVRNLAEWQAYVANTARVNKHRYGHMKKRPYELTWEPNLSGPHYSGKPPYWTARDTVDFYRDSVPAIRKVDDNALILGPKSAGDLNYIEETLKLGLGKYLDGISLHLYSTPAPEEGNLPAMTARLRAMSRQYLGREVDLYNTEAGYHSRINGEHDLKGQARRLIRYALIMHGEGIKAFLMFYLFDHGLDDYGSWGLYFNPRANADFSPAELMPKPVAAAYSVTTSLLRGARPRMHLRWIDTDIWGYVFERDNKPVIALWDPYRTRTIRFPVGNVRSVTQVGFMGRRTEIPVKDGVADLTLSQDVLYLLGADPELWLNAAYDGILPDRGIAPAELYLGESKTLPAENVKAVKSFGPLRAELKSGRLHLTVPEQAFPGILPLVLTGKDNRNRIRFVRINAPLQISSMEMTQEKDKMVLNVSVRNTARLPIRGDLKLTSPAGIVQKKMEFPAGKETTVVFPVQKITSNFDPLTPFKGELQLKTETQWIKKDLQFTFLAAWENDKPVTGKLFTNEVELKGAGASGKEDRARVRFSRAADGLHLRIECQDDVFHQQYPNEDLWRNDSIQLAFDTDPANPFEYDELTARTSKKVTSIGLALSPKGPVAHRYLTFNEKILKTGTISGEIPISVKRTGNVTQYDILIPWDQIGLKREEAKAGKQLGFALLVNDSDGEKTQRKVLPLFGGIFDNSGWRRYGILTLK